MARVTSSSSGGIVQITDSEGNPLTSSGGALNVNANATPAGFATLTPGYPLQITVGNTSIELLPANSNRKYAHIINNSKDNIFIQFSVSAALNQGIKVSPGSLYIVETTNLWLGSINGIGLIANQLIDVLEAE